jgi:glycosyltransferase involved in cell wall biosynthesis
MGLLKTAIATDFDKDNKPRVTCFSWVTRFCRSSMKLIIQLPCYNEEQTLASTLAELPRQIPGVDCIEVLVVDDGSTDRTAEIARQAGVPHVISLGKNRGLGTAFRLGLEACLSRGADLIVNTDGDNQYSAADIPRLIQPLLEGKADLVVGIRNIEGVADFSPLKKRLQRWGSWVVRQAARCQIEDTTSGFRAYNREAALQLNVFSGFSYTLETLIQAGQSNLRLTAVPITVNRKMRESRLAGSIREYIQQSAITVLRIYATYNPMRVFLMTGGLCFGAGALVALRYLAIYLFQSSGGHIQSLILSAILIILGVQLFAVGLVSELVSVNRRLNEEILYRLRKLDLSKKLADSTCAQGNLEMPENRANATLRDGL